MAAVFTHRSRSARRVHHADQQLEMGGSTRSFLPSWREVLELALVGATCWVLFVGSVIVVLPD